VNIGSAPGAIDGFSTEFIGTMSFCCTSAPIALINLAVTFTMPVAPYTPKTINFGGTDYCNDFVNGTTYTVILS